MLAFEPFGLDELPNCGESNPVPSSIVYSQNRKMQMRERRNPRITRDSRCMDKGSACGGPGHDSSQDATDVWIGVDRRNDHGGQKCERAYIMGH